jgi:hypothetical protein
MNAFDTVLIDADQLVYSVGFASKGEPLAYTLSTVKHALDKIQHETGAANREIYIKGVGNFRDAVATGGSYKANRSAPKPETYDDIREYLCSVQGAILCDGMEADDAVSIRLYEEFKAKGGDQNLCTLILSSPDKDLKGVPGWHHNPRTSEVVWYSDFQSYRFFLFQLLMGDTTDNIKGLPLVSPAHGFALGLSQAAWKKGVGKETAKKIMACAATIEEAERLVYTLYKGWGTSQGYSDEDTKAYCLEQGQLLWMVREVQDGLPVMWQINEELWNTVEEL